MLNQNSNAESLGDVLYVLSSNVLDDVLFVDRVIGRPLKSADELFRSDSWRTQRGFTVLLICSPYQAASQFDECLETILRNGGRLCSLIFDGPLIFVGPVKSASSRGACPECLRIRIRQRLERNRPGIESQTEKATPKLDSFQPAVLGIVASLLRYTLAMSGDQMGTGTSWLLQSDRLSCNSVHVVRSQSCTLCNALAKNLQGYREHGSLGNYEESYG
jgi:bacteriocin biosynthesis cyclodehydratase domain-containing protein